jgi:VanZ family protein
VSQSRRLALWAPVVAHMALIFGLSSIHHPPSLPEVPGIGADKLAHAALYGLLSVLIVRAMTGGWTRPISMTIAAVAVAWSVAYGASDEFHQSFVPPREVDAADLLADAVGATIAAGVLYTGIIRPRHDL